ncbi:MAG: CRTAC1 family protein, partial [Acidobacteriota bacterium]
GFGTNFFDMDSDGDQDIFVANGHIMDHPRFLSDATSYAQRNQLYENQGGHFSDISARGGAHFRDQKVSRGTAFGDWDNDGDVDLLVMNNNEAPNLLRNESPRRNHWILLRLVGGESNRDGIGALVRLEAGSSTQVDELRSGTSYLSNNDLRLHFGLGRSPRIDRLEVRWPSGVTQVFQDLPADRLVLIRESADPEPLELSLE